MQIAFIGFGEAARAFHDSLKAHEPSLVFSTYDILFDSEGLEGACATAAARSAGLRSHCGTRPRSPRQRD